jgi:diguanylate cyclase
MIAGSEADAARRWRDKYLNLLDEHEKLKTSTEDRSDQLRRGLLMVSLLAEGQAGNVDSALGNLRETMKGNGLRLNHSMDELEKVVRHFENQNEAQASLLTDELNAVADKLLQCPLPKELLKKIREVRKSTAKDLSTWAGYISQLKAWSDILSAVATLEGYDERAKSSAWWQRWLKPQEKVEEPALAEEIAADESTAKQEPGFSHIATDVADTLGNLLSHLVIPERLETRLTALQERLNSGLNWYELVPLLEDTSQFLLDCLGSGQEEFERFLQSLDQRLQAIQLMVSDANTGQSDREKARHGLESMVREQIADIRSVVNGLGDLGELGSSIRDHLTLIVQAMEHYQKCEIAREQRLAEQLQVMQTRLNEMETEASQARQIIEDQKSRATQDHLTGLPNRGAYQVRLDEELSRRSRMGGTLSIIIADVDYFKRINDDYGHLAGDKVLQLLASTLRKNLRTMDFIARYGGEEFVILLPETNAQEAMSVAEKLRSKIEACPFNFRSERLVITMSFGVSEFHTLEASETVFDRADKALYKAKKEGRNQCQRG